MPPTDTRGDRCPSTSEVGLDPGTFTITRTGATTFALGVTFATTGTATVSTDFSLSPASTTSIVIPAGQASVTVTVTPRNDGVVEGPETVVLTLVDGANYDLGAATTATVTIADNPVPLVSVTVPDSAASEVGPDTGTFRFSRTGDPSLPLTVTFTTTGTATPGSDFVAIGTSITFPAGQATVDLVVIPVTDTTPERPRL
jgi:hypothetical protein